MFNKYILPLLAVGMLAFAVYRVALAQLGGPMAEPPVQPARTPFGRTVAGSGIVEPQTENISIGSHFPGIVHEIFVKVGTEVSAGRALFRLDDRQLKAELVVREANLVAAQAQLHKLESMPRSEELPASEARVHEAQANLADQEDQLKRTRALYASRSVGEEERVRREQATRVAREQLARAGADFALLKAGAWEPDKANARATVAQMQAQVEQTRIELTRLVVAAPVDGEVLQVNVRPGEFVGAPPGQALIVLGNVHRLHVRVDIDEHDIHRFRSDATAKAMLRGDPRQEYDLKFVRVEPYVIPKKSLTGDNSERVDTRVLQVIYSVDTTGKTPLFVGQQVDAFVDVLQTGE